MSDITDLMDETRSYAWWDGFLTGCEVVVLVVGVACAIAAACATAVGDVLTHHLRHGSDADRLSDHRRLP